MMAKRVLLPILLALVGLLSPAFAPAPFTLHIVDEQTGAGVPLLRVTDAEGMVRHTGSHGELIIWKRSSAGGDRYIVQDETNEFVSVNTRLTVTPGGHATLEVRRRS